MQVLRIDSRAATVLVLATALVPNCLGISLRGGSLRICHCIGQQHVRNCLAALAAAPRA